MKIELSKKVLSQLEADILNAAIMGMSYGHYKAYQRSLEEKRKKRGKERKPWMKEK